MIVAEQKSLDEVKTLVGDAEKVLVVGCGTCVTVCFAGGAGKQLLRPLPCACRQNLTARPRTLTM